MSTMGIIALPTSESRYGGWVRSCLYEIVPQSRHSINAHSFFGATFFPCTGQCGLWTACIRTSWEVYWKFMATPPPKTTGLGIPLGAENLWLTSSPGDSNQSSFGTLILRDDAFPASLRWALRVPHLRALSPVQHGGLWRSVAPQEIPGKFSLEKDRLVFKGKMETYSS